MKYTLGNTVNQEDKTFYTEIYEDRNNNGPAVLYAQIYADSKDESRERALAIVNILKAAKYL